MASVFFIKTAGDTIRPRGLRTLGNDEKKLSHDV